MEETEETFKLDTVQSFELKYDSLNVTAVVEQKVDIGGGKMITQPT